MCAIRERREVPRVLLKGGKRSKQEWIRTQERVAASRSNSGECDSQGCDGVSDMMRGWGMEMLVLLCHIVQGMSSKWRGSWYGRWVRKVWGFHGWGGTIPL